MIRTLHSLLLLGLTAACTAYAQGTPLKEGSPQYKDSLKIQAAIRPVNPEPVNLPLFQTKYTADPSPLVIGDTLFLFTSHDASPEDIPDENEKNSAGFFMYDWLLWSTTDMVNWTEHGAVASLKDFSWRSRENGAWAIQTVERNGKYYLYAPLHGHGIGVLVSDSPYGPFRDPLGEPIVWQREHWNDIDPTVFTDDDGQAYMYWGNPHTYYALLNDDMISIKKAAAVPVASASKEAATVPVASASKEAATVPGASASGITQLPHIDHYQEGPWFYKRNGKYYLGFASTCCPEGLGYAMSDSSTGPWTSTGYIMRPTERDRGNHPGIADFKGHTYIFGQNYDLMHIETFTHHERRSVSVAEMHYNADGTIEEVPYWLDHKPLQQLHWLNPYQRVEAETMAWGYGLKSAKMGVKNTGVVADMPLSTGKRNMYIYDIDNGEYIKLRGVDFGQQGPRQFVAVAAATGSATLTLRIDGQQGPVIGTVDIKSTGSVDQYKVFSTALEPAVVTGVHDLYLCFANVEGDVHFDWWQFTAYPWQDASLPRAERVENLLDMLTPEEKVGLMMNKSASVDRLGIPSYNWWSEACHGVRQGGYTVYPQPIGMAAAFNAQLVRDVFSQVSDEARANWNRSNHNIFNVPMGVTYYPGNPELSFWCPNVNIFRDPRWGRGQETCGEDPYMNAVLGVQTVLGMQEPQCSMFNVQSSIYKTHACAKHYAVHSGPEPLRHSMNVEPTNRDLWETYLPAFKALVKKANVREVMCAYQRFEGRPCCTSDRLLIDILRNKWGYDGLVVTDCDAINNFFNRGQHETHKDPLSASVDAVLNGTDLECGKVFMSLTDGLKQGLIKESDLDQHLRKTLTGRFELGMFDPAETMPWASLGSDVISSEKHDQLATQAARESMVLLENSSVLPLSKTLKTIAVVGPNADDVELLNGNYGGTPTKAHQHSLLEGIRKAVPATNIIYHKACELNDEYETVHHLQDFNDGRGVKVEFFNNAALEGSPVKTDYYNELNFSTFGAWGFAQGVNRDTLSVRVSGQYKATFTGEMKYTLATDNGYIIKVNGEVVEEAQGGGRRGFGFRRNVEYKSFPVVEGQTYDVCIEYRHGNGQFAMLRGDICERKLADFTDLANELKQADAIIIIGGISARMEGEGGDKQDIELPKVQQRLVRAMHQTGRPVVFVNCSGSAIAFGSVEGQYDALLQAWYPGQGGAKALAEVLFGDYNPGGKLPVTFYRSTDDLPDFLDYSMKNRTYRYFTGKPQYAFGYGLSYTTFSIGKATLNAKSKKAVALAKGNDGVTLTVPVTNTGSREGTETVQVYVKRLDDPGAPLKALKGFQKLSLQPGETKTAVITLDAEAFEYYDDSIDELAVKPGRYQLLYGTSSRDEDLQAFDFVVK